jgi:hypothetical protein
MTFFDITGTVNFIVQKLKSKNSVFSRYSFFEGMRENILQIFHALVLSLWYILMLLRALKNIS